MEYLKIEDLTADLALEKTPEQIFKECFVDLDAPIKPLDVLVYFGVDDRGDKSPAITRGELSCIYAPSKVKKSFLKTLVESAFIGGNHNIYSDQIVGNRRTEGYLISIDTEQGEFYAANSFRRPERIVGSRYKNYIPLQMRRQGAKDRLKVLEWLIYKSPYAGKIDMITIDGLADLIDNTNDIIVSTELAENLLRWSGEGIHICFILHKNPGSGKARGHIGTITAIKCETMISIDALTDEDGNGEKNTVKISCGRSRGLGYNEFYLSVNKDSLPFTHENEMDNDFERRLQDYKEPPLKNVEPKEAFGTNGVPF